MLKKMWVGQSSVLGYILSLRSGIIGLPEFNRLSIFPQSDSYVIYSAQNFKPHSKANS